MKQHRFLGWIGVRAGEVREAGLNLAIAVGEHAEIEKRRRNHAVELRLNGRIVSEHFRDALRSCLHHLHQRDRASCLDPGAPDRGVRRAQNIFQKFRDALGLGALPVGVARGPYGNHGRGGERRGHHRRCRQRELCGAARTFANDRPA